MTLGVFFICDIRFDQTISPQSWDYDEKRVTVT